MKGRSFIVKYWWLIIVLVVACSGGADSTPSGDDSSNDGSGSRSSASSSEDGDGTGEAGGSGDSIIDPDLIPVGDAGGSGDTTDPDLVPDGSAGGSSTSDGPDGSSGATSTSGPDAGTSDGPGDTDGGTTYDPGVDAGTDDPGVGGSGSTSDPGVGGSGTTTDPGTGGGDTGDPGTGGGDTGDPGTGGGDTGDPGTGGATQDPGTGGATQDPGVGGSSSPGLGGATQDPGVGGTTNDPGVGGSGGTGGYEPPDEDCPWVCIPTAILGVNLLVLNDANPTGADVEGRMYVGNNAVLPDGYAVGVVGTDIGVNEYTLVVGNDLSFGSGTVHGNAAYGGSLTLGGGAHATGDWIQDTPVDFEQLTNDMLYWSDTLAETPANGTVGTGGNLSLVGTAADINVFEVQAADLANASQLSITVPDGSTVLINVIGTDISITNMGFNYIGTDSQHVIFNMPQAETIFMSGISLQGTLLAPRADLNFENGNAEGQTIVYNLVTGGGEYHPYYFEGCPWVCL